MQAKKKWKTDSMDFHKEKLRRILKWFSGMKAPPFKAVLIPTNRCNLKCFFCPNALPRNEGKFNPEDELTKDKWLKTVGECLDSGVWEWCIIGGGEPLIRCDVVVPLIGKIKEFDERMNCELITNGTMFQEDDIEKLVKLKIDRIIFSIDGPDAETHDYLRGVKGAFAIAIKNLKLFSEIKKKLKAEKPYLKINMVLNNKNYDKIIKMLKFIKRIGVQELALHTMREYWELNPQIQCLKLNPQQKKELMIEVEKGRKLSEKNDITLNTDMLNSTENDGGFINKSELIENIIKANCFEPFYSILIDPEGKVAQCAPAGSGYGNLSVDRKSIRNVWYSKKLNSVRKKVLEGGTLDCCIKCGLTDMKEHLRRDLINFLRDGE